MSWMRGIPLLEAYASAKAAIVGFTNTLARALGPYRIRVNAIAPGTVLTERQRELWFQIEAQVQAARAAQCLPDLIGPDEMEASCVLAASRRRCFWPKQLPSGRWQSVRRPLLRNRLTPSLWETGDFARSGWLEILAIVPG